MRELSEKELELEYKNLKLTDIPDMWENIERNLAPKNPVKAEQIKEGIQKKKPEKQQAEAEIQQKKKVVPIRRISSIAAAVAVVLLLVPVANVVMSGGKSEDAAANQEEAIADMSEGVKESATESMSYPETEADTSAKGDSAWQDLAESEMVEDAEFAQEETEAPAQEENNSASTEALETEVPKDNVEQTLRIQIRQIQESEDGLMITATVLEQLEDSSGEDSKNSVADQIVVITYSYGEAEGATSYQRADFSNTMTVLVEETEENFKLLKILP